MLLVPDPLPTWLTISPTAVLPAWKVVRVEYVSTDDPRNNGSTNIYYKTLDAAGNYQQGVKVWQAWPDDKAQGITRKQGDLDFNGEPFGYTFPMSGDSSFDPNRGQHGPYFGYVDGASDTVNGMGVPLRRHVQFLLVWQWTITPPIPPIPPTGKWSVASQDATHINLVLA